ncbi:orotidine-5'-phosphate decarboxylase [Naasia lichenicola]|uniref:Orotidine-5'-phosphate decarboxylase n=1 Tax=Naasia lichenicola TaxID=2565933 RepID=A0A4S4FTZ0_9MICO|nr:orotidine-5'-phosphate decarboxylase [Naasia lichenicola]THG33056.1 orotidine-5'-phosphate decarboxylase [Naasia lichenicola]
MNHPRPESFGARLGAAFDAHGHLCVGIDPHEYLLSDWGLAQSATGALEFGLRVVEACAGRVGIIKPQVAFYERFGSLGFRALEDVLASARDAGLLVIADAKRGDLGSTFEAYAAAWFGADSPLEADALTVAPYMGFGSLAAPLAQAKSRGKGIFVLAATSNPEAGELQTATVSRGSQAGSSVAGSIAAAVAAYNAEHYEAERLGSIGVVIGATVDVDELGISVEGLAASPAAPVLAPGFGFQGAEAGDVRRILGASADHAIVTASRSILSAGPGGLGTAIDKQVRQVSEAYE